MERNDKIDKLFKKWPKEGIHKFERDGIVDEPEWNRQEIKMLYVLKEAHDPPVIGKPFEEIDKREFYYNGAFDGENVYFNTFRLLSKWSYGICNNFCSWHDIEKIDFNTCDSMAPWLRKAAIINIKKHGGHSSSEYPIIRQYADDHRDLIKKQIELIEPDIIVGGGKNFVAPIIIHHIFNPIEFKKLECKTNLNVWEHRNLGWRLIDWYHPQAPGIKHEFLFSKLINTVNEISNYA